MFGHDLDGAVVEDVDDLTPHTVGPIQPRPRVGSAEYGNLVAPDEQLNDLGAVARLSSVSEPRNRLKIR
jgi:hypothetical protein